MSVEHLRCEHLILIILSGQMATQKQAKATEKAICEFCGQGSALMGLDHTKKLARSNKKMKG